MIRSRDCDALLRVTLLDEGVGGAGAPPVAAMRALHRRQRQRHLARLITMAAAVLTVLLPGWWMLRKAPAHLTPSPPSPPWLIHTADLSPVEIIRTRIADVMVYSSLDLPPGLVIHTRAGLFAPASDEMLLALLADRSPLLLGEPGARRLVFDSDAAPR